jgi:hypothetical protein
MFGFITSSRPDTNTLQTLTAQTVCYYDGNRWSENGKKCKRIRFDNIQKGPPQHKCQAHLEATLTASPAAADALFLG